MANSSRSHSDALRLTDLPKGVHVHICHMVRDGGDAQRPPSIFSGMPTSDTMGRRQRPLELSLKGVKEIISPLPLQLLSAARSSRALAAAVAEIQGDSVVALTANNTRTMFLPEWVTAMRDHVKAISTWDRQAIYASSFCDNARHPHLSPENLLNDGVRLLEAMRVAAIPLQVLELSYINLQEVAMDQDKVADDLKESLMAARDSLRELSLPVSPITAKAMSQVALPNLSILEIHFKAVLAYVERVEIDGASGIFGIADMLQAVESTMGSESEIHELRMFEVLEAPFVNQDSPGYCKRLCKGVRSLKIQLNSWIDSKKPKEDDNIAMFIALFSNLEYLQWNGDVTPKHIETIRKGCPSLQRVVLEPRNGFKNLSGQGALRRERDTEILGNIFEACQGSLFGLKLIANMPVEQWTRLGNNSPWLESLQIEIGPQTVSALVPLLDTHCRKMRRLNLSYSPDSSESLRAEGWTTFASAVQSASAELREVTFDSDDEHEPLELALDETLAAMIAIMESLGERASRILFHIPYGTCNNRIFVTAMTRLLRAAAEHCTNLENLSLQLHVADVDYHWDGEDDRAAELWRDLLQAREEFLEKASRLQGLYIGGMERDAREYLDGHL